VVESDDDDDNNFLYHQLPVYHCNPADESDDSLSDISYHDNDKHDNLSSDLLCQEDEQTDSMSERQGNSASKGKVLDLMKEPILHLKGTLDLMKKLIPHLKVQMDQALAPVDPSDPSTPILALPFLQMMKQHSALPHSFPRTRLILSNLSL
jgi:hypothetical protein